MMRTTKRMMAVLLATLMLLGMTASLALAQGGDKVPLNILWRVKRSGTNDRMTSNNWNEAKNYTFEGATYYIPSYLTGASPLYRLIYSWDHMDSMTSGEGGYTTEGPLGYPYSSQVTGTEQIVRKWNTSNGDHALGPNWESLTGYTNESPGTAYAYPRYLNANYSLLSLTAGGVTAKSNLVCGGAIWEWTWNSVQFVNDKDYGREMQSAVFFLDGNSVQCNPTEAGDEWTATSTYGRRHGSPCYALYNNGSVQTSRSIPLEWLPQDHSGGEDTPVLWEDMRLGKDLTLNFNSMGAVARYTTYFYTPTDMTSTHIEVPTMYMRAAFNYFYNYDAVSQTLTRVYPGSGGSNPVLSTPSYGGVIISNSTGTQAVGCYGVAPASGGSATFFGLWDFSSQGGTGQYDSGCTKWSMVYGPTSISAGEHTYNAYICTGTLSSVQTYMNSLYSQGVY